MSDLVRRSPRKSTAITHGPRRQLCQKCTGPDRHFRVDCPDHSGKARRAKKLQNAQQQRQVQLARAAQPDVPNTCLTPRTTPELNGISPETAAQVTTEITDVFRTSSSSRTLVSEIFGAPTNLSSVIQPISGDREPTISPQRHMDSIFPAVDCDTELGIDSGSTVYNSRDMANITGLSEPNPTHQLLTMRGTPVPGEMVLRCDPNTPIGSPRNAMSDDPCASLGRKRKRSPLTLPGQQRIRPSKSNPIYGLVDGAKRGSEQWEVARKVPQFNVLPTWADCNKKFNEKMQAVLRLAEETADETGSWIYVAAQMPTGRHEYTHFASRRLRKEAPGPVNDINAIAHNMFRGLVNSRRKDVLQLELEVASQRTDMQRLAEEKVALSRAKDDAEAIIQGLRSRLATSNSLSAEELRVLLEGNVFDDLPEAH
ncbi:hypothetical protein VNI00_006102 [Paramarasmius palmivorus]|uniref:Uncharacterized protein n=1 Tax=Paramarasmius palmivorus TaxID=297713 RepID=A0AAW0D844_9AGAR